MDLRRISAKDTYPIRKKVLIPEGCEGEVSIEFEHDNDEDLAFHLGVFLDGKLASVTSMFFLSHPDIPDEYQYQLRGMATLPEYQRQGLSSELLKMAFSIVKQNQCHVVWCHAQGIYGHTN